MKTFKIAACLVLLIQALIFPAAAAPAPQAERPSGDQSVAASWQSGPALPQALAALGVTVVSERLITVGGQNSTGSTGTPVTDVYKSTIGSGSPGAWSVGSKLDRKLAAQGVVVAQGRVYLIGGRSGDEAIKDVRYALPDRAGNLSNWREAESLPKRSSMAGVAVYGGFIYLAGGYDGGEVREEVFYSAVGAGGVLGDWESGPDLPVALRSLTLTAANGYLYAIGGADGSDHTSAQVYRAKINANGSLAAWQALTSLPQALERHATVVYGGRLVVLGGLNASGNSTNTVYAANLNADGSLGAWQTGFLPSLPQPLDRHAAVVASVSGCGEVIYVVGGRNGAAYQNTVYSTTCTAAPRQKTYIPLVQNGVTEQPEIYGRILQRGVGVPGVAVELHYYNGTKWNTVREVTTDASGNYSFLGVPILGAAEMYNVAFSNTENDTTRLAYIQSFVITTFLGGRLSGGDLEVQNVYQISPDYGASVTLPATFCWQPRGISGDLYYLALLDLDTGDSYWYGAGTSSCFVIEELPPGFQQGKQYGWAIGVENDPADNYEWGLSFYYTVTFQATAAGINGGITYNGAPASGIDLTLRFYNGSSWSDAASTTTGADGRYQFLGVPGLSTGQGYYVRYGPNGTNSAYLSGWAGPTITSYSAGSAAPGGDFDIANVSLLSPSNGSTKSFPVTFTWQRRGLPGDTYRLVIFDLDTGNGWLTADLGDVSGVTVTGLSGVVYGKQYGWYVRVYHGSDSYGASFYLGLITFSSSQAVVPDGLPQPSVFADVVPGALDQGLSPKPGLGLDSIPNPVGHGRIMGDTPSKLQPEKPW